MWWRLVALRLARPDLALQPGLDGLDAGVLGPPGLGVAERRGLGDSWFLEADRILSGLGPLSPPSVGDAYATLLGDHDAAGDGVQQPGGSRRRRQGSFYTPGWLAAYVAAEAGLTWGSRVLDPACGAGHLLLAAGSQLLGAGVSGAASALHGVDPDPGAVELCRLLLWLGGLTVPEGQIVVGDGLRVADDGPLFDAVIANPPFLSQLGRATMADAGRRAELAKAFPGLVDAYTDHSGLFLAAGAGRLRPGGRLVFVLPQSILAAAHAQALRAVIANNLSFSGLWLTGERVFDGADVQVLVLTLVKDGPRKVMMRRSFGTAFRELPALDLDMDTLGGSWAPLVSDALGVPALPAFSGGTLGELITATADFRDEYYGLSPYTRDQMVADERRCPRLILTRHLEPGHAAWGEVPVRFLKEKRQYPRVDLDAIPIDGPEAWLHRWATRRLRPKLLLATQTRVLEAAVDAEGAWLSTTPVLNVFPKEETMLWHVAAVLLAPVASAWALRHYGGAALDLDAIKLSARQVAEVPLPRPCLAWDEAAALLAEGLPGTSPVARDAVLSAAARRMGEAYGADPRVLDWWRARRLPKAGRRA